MGMDLKTKIRKFHQAKWDEPILFELSQPGERGILMPKADAAIEEEVGDGLGALPEHMVRTMRVLVGYWMRLVPARSAPA
mgnify:CR=1 FL=1